AWTWWLCKKKGNINESWPKWFPEHMLSLCDLSREGGSTKPEVGELRPKHGLARGGIGELHSSEDVRLDSCGSYGRRPAPPGTVSCSKPAGWQPVICGGHDEDTGGQVKLAGHA